MESCDSTQESGFSLDIENSLIYQLATRSEEGDEAECADKIRAPS